MNIKKKKTIFKILFLLIPIVFFPETYISYQQLRKAEQKLLDLVNIERKGKGLISLEFNESLYRIAMDHNIKMAKENKLEHNFAGYLKLEERMVTKGMYFSSAGENIAFSNVYPSDFIHAGFIKSPLHYENIINPEFRQAGMAILETSEGFYITQEFGNIITEISSERAVERISEFIVKNKLFSNIQISRKIKENFKKDLKKISKKLLKEEKFSNIADKMEGYDFLTMKSNKLDKIEEYLLYIKSKNKYGSYGFDISSGRNKKFRGGVFSFVIVLREKFIKPSFTISEMELAIVHILNNKFKSITGKSFSYSKYLSREADKAVQKYYTEDSSLLVNSRFNILAYQCFNPLKIPDEQNSFFISNKVKKMIGIKILRPEKNGIPENYFLLAFVFRK